MNTKNKKADVVIDHQIKILLVAAVVVIALVFIFWKTGFIDYFKNLPDFNSTYTLREGESREVTILGNPTSLILHDGSDPGRCKVSPNTKTRADLSKFGLNLKTRKLDWWDGEKWIDGAADKIIAEYIPDINNEDKIQDMIFKVNLREALKEKSQNLVPNIEEEDGKPNPYPMRLGTQGIYINDKRTQTGWAFGVGYNREGRSKKLYLWGRPYGSTQWMPYSQKLMEDMTAIHKGWIWWIYQTFVGEGGNDKPLTLPENKFDFEEEKDKELTLEADDYIISKTSGAILTVNIRNQDFGIDSYGDLYWLNSDRSIISNLKKTDKEEHLNLPLKGYTVSSGYDKGKWVEGWDTVLEKARLKRDLLRECIDPR